MDAPEGLLRGPGLWRAGWRAAIFIALLFLPYWIVGLFVKSGPTAQAAVFDVSVEMIMSYALLVFWAVVISWLCLRFLEGMKLSALGFALYTGWFRDLVKGCVMAALMMTSVTLLQVLGGATRLRFNPIWRGERGVDLTGLRVVVAEIIIALVLLILAGALEELWYRGYAFQTLLRGAPAVIPILLFSLFFGLAHLKNPNRTFFSTANTVLAGIWLSIAYLRTRGLWFPTALHFTWNWMMGAVFGIPVSGLHIPEHSILISTNVGPVWLTGGNYGSEGGVAATITLIIAIVVIWRARWLRVSPEMSEMSETPETPEMNGASAPRQA
jgi:membrane protease YdiL (CAAX protease family)